MSHLALLPRENVQLVGKSVFFRVGTWRRQQKKRIAQGMGGCCCYCWCFQEVGPSRCGVA